MHSPNRLTCNPHPHHTVYIIYSSHAQPCPIGLVWHIGPFCSPKYTLTTEKNRDTFSSLVNKIRKLQGEHWLFQNSSYTSDIQVVAASQWIRILITCEMHTAHIIIISSSAWTTQTRKSIPRQQISKLQSSFKRDATKVISLVFIDKVTNSE